MPKGETVDDGASERRRPPMDLDGFLSALAIEAALLYGAKRGNPRKLTDGDTFTALSSLCKLPHHEDPGAANG